MNIRRRLFYFAIGAIAIVIAFTLGSHTDVDKKEIENRRQEFEKQYKDFNLYSLFLNNVRLSFLMFAPGAGIAIGIISVFHTGLTFRALLESSALLNNVSPLVTLATPYGALEVLAYGLAMSRSGILVYQIVKSRWRDYVIPTLIEIGLVTMILFIAAIVEWYIIEQFGFANRLNYFLSSST